MNLEVGEMLAAIAEDREGSAGAQALDDVFGDLFVAGSGGNQGGPESVDESVRFGQFRGAVADD